MKNSHKYLRIYLLSLFTVILAATVLRSIAILTELDFTSGYFDNKVIISIANGLVMAMALLSLTYFAVAKHGELVASFGGAVTYVPSGLVAVALIFISAELLSTNIIARGGTVMGFFTALLALVSVAHFLYNALIVKKENSHRAWFSLATIIFLAAYATYLYFDVSLPLNSPNKIVDMMAFLFSALFFLYETRISLGRDSWRAYISFGIIASLITAYSSIPSIITYFVRGEVISNSITETALTFTLFIFITARLLMVSELKDNEKSEIAALVFEMEARRKEQIKENIAAREQSELNEANSEEEDNNYRIQTLYPENGEEAPDTTEEGDEV